MSRAINREEAMVPELELTVPEKAIGLLPVVLPILGTILLIRMRKRYFLRSTGKQG